MSPGMSWVVGDSEDESDLAIPPPVQTHSSISDFTPHEIVLPGNISAISDFTNGTSMKAADTTADSIIVPSTSADIPVKPKRPKPRPAYKGTKTSPPDQGGSSSSGIAAVAGRTGVVSMDRSLLDASVSLAIAQSAKALRRASANNFVNLCSSDVEAEYITGTNQVEMRQISEERQRSPSARQSDVALRSDGPLPAGPDPSSSVSHAARPSSPPYHRVDSPPSSPFKPQSRKKKRKAPAEDFDFLDDSVIVENRDRSLSTSHGKEQGPGLKKQRKDKEKKRHDRKGKGKEKDPAENDETSNSRKRQTKAKNKDPEQEFKSKEFVSDSEDDDLLLVPRSSKSASRIHCSDPATIEVSTRASPDVSVQPSPLPPSGKPAPSSASAVPSAAASVQPSAAISDPPLISAPPPSPLAVRSEKPKPKKAKRKDVFTDRSSDAARTTDLRDCALAGDSGGAITTPGKEPKKSKKQSRRPKNVELASTSKDGEGGMRNLQTHHDTGSAEQQDHPVTGKSRSKETKERKKQRAIVSSDEDEPEVESFTKIDPAVMEVDRTKVKGGGSPSADKENQVVPGPNDRKEKVPEPPPASALDTAQSRQPNPIPKRHLSTPKMPSRRDSMSALIRRVSSKVQSPLGTPAPVHAYSPLAKASRAALSRIAPLHPNRRTPPPPPPRPPAPKKSKKMLELEEKWEMELAESVDGWSCMTDEERAALRRAKRDAELGYDD